jgi:hypothetical protein
MSQSSSTSLPSTLSPSTLSPSTSLPRVVIPETPNSKYHHLSASSNALSPGSSQQQNVAHTVVPETPLRSVRSPEVIVPGTLGTTEPRYVQQQHRIGSVGPVQLFPPQGGPPQDGGSRHKYAFVSKRRKLKSRSKSKSKKLKSKSKRNKMQKKKTRRIRYY